ncbi:hypothetical protein AB0D40_41405 [Streptomyces massasporeus]|uniref:hypothetical protein n=1 Tax=Streptomyces massasporeus TaxID=67324 RepID=UPI0033E5CA28
MSNNEQRAQQQVPAPQQLAPEPRGDFAKKGALAAISGACSGAARAVMAHLLGGDS